MNRQVRCRIVVEQPLAGVSYAVQRRQSELLEPIRSSASELVFEFPLTVVDAGTDPPRLTGEYAQGPAKQRFVYVNSGSRAGQPLTPWTRRAKVPLYVLTTTLLAEAMARDAEEVRLEARIHGVARDGGPACATVPLLSGWAVVAGA